MKFIYLLDHKMALNQVECVQCIEVYYYFIWLGLGRCSNFQQHDGTIHEDMDGNPQIGFWSSRITNKQLAWASYMLYIP
jgi:hypothetical protein